MPSSLLDKPPTSPQLNTYLTSCEWRIVDMSTEYANHCLSGKSFFSFPYFSQVTTLWSIFGQSYALAKKHDTPQDILLSANMMMNLFVTVFTSVEFLAKGLLTYPANFLLKKDNKTPFQIKAGEIAKEYVELIKDDAFYTVPYLKQLAELYKSFYHAKNKSKEDAFTLFALSFEHLAKQLISVPFLILYGLSEYLSNDDSYWQKNITIEYPKNKTLAEKTELVALIKNRIRNEVVSNAKYQKDIEVIKEEDEIIQLKCGRYDSFMTLLHILTELDFSIKKIEGNAYMQVRIKDNATSNATTNAIDRLCHNGITRHYQYKNSIDNHATFFSLDVPVEKVPQLLNDLDNKENDNLTLHWCHDF